MEVLKRNPTGLFAFMNQVINRDTLERLHRRVLYKLEKYREMADTFQSKGYPSSTVKTFLDKADSYQSFSDDLMLALDGEEVPEPGKPWKFDETLGFDLK